MANQLFVHGAEHHRPPPQPNMALVKLTAMGKALQTDPWGACRSCLWKIFPCSCLCEGVDDISTPLGRPAPTSKNNKWNVPGSSAAPTPAASSKWNTPQTGKWNTPQPSGSFQPAPQQHMSQQSMGMGGMGGGMMVPQQPGMSGGRVEPMQSQGSFSMQSSNPVFAAEAHNTKRYSVDV